MGDQLRYASNGPLALEDSDYRQDGKPKVITRSERELIRTTARFNPRIDRKEHDELLKILDQRGATQRGKPRSRDPAKNPLGSRVFDMACGWPMYRTPYNKTFRYVCGGYMQARQCEHNHIDGLIATRFAVSCLRQKLSPVVLEKLQARLRALAASETSTMARAKDQSIKQVELEKLKADLLKVTHNMAFAENDEQRRAMAAIFEKTRAQVAALGEQLAADDHHECVAYDADVEVAAAMSVLGRLPDLAADDENLAKVGEALRLVNLRMFLKFEKVQVKNRQLNKLAHGLVTFGDVPAPVPLYAGPTGRRAKTATTAAAFAAGSGNGSVVPNSLVSGEEGNSLGNVSRGDRI